MVGLLEQHEILFLGGKGQILTPKNIMEIGTIGYDLQWNLLKLEILKQTPLKQTLFPGPARLFLTEFTSINWTRKPFGQRIKNSFYCFYFFSSKYLFTTRSCSLIIKLTFFDTQATAFS